MLVSADGQTVAARGTDGRLSIQRRGGDPFTTRQWLAADADARLPTDPALAEGFRCDESGCIARLADGKLVARVLTADALAEDCERASVVVTARDAPPRCAALVIDRNVSRARGAIALTRAGDGWEIAVARPSGQDRPWARAMPSPTDVTLTSPAARPAPRDATPRMEDLEVGDTQ